MMRSRFILAAGVFLIAAAEPARAETRTVTGELVTIMCYTGHGDDGRGAKHASCALKCAKEGYPLAVLTEAGELYKITGTLTDDNNASLRPLLTKTVDATGDVAKDGDTRTIAAATVVERK